MAALEQGHRVRHVVACKTVGAGQPDFAVRHAKQALEIGLVNAVLPRGDLMAHCRKVAEKIATRGPLAVARAKRLVERGYDIPLRAANRQEAETFALLFDTQDRAEGMRAFLEKRPAKFVGK